MTLEYLQWIDFIQSDSEAYRLTSHGRAHIEYPQPNYPELSLIEAEKSNRIATRALYIEAFSLLVGIASLYITWHLIVSP